MELCNGFHGNKAECNAAGHGVLCSYVPATEVCIASPTGKVRLRLWTANELTTSLAFIDSVPGDLQAGAVKSWRSVIFFQLKREKLLVAFGATKL